jgi:hypothetical protein
MLDKYADKIRLLKEEGASLEDIRLWLASETIKRNHTKQVKLLGKGKAHAKPLSCSFSETCFKTMFSHNLGF